MRDRLTVPSHPQDHASSMSPASLERPVQYSTLAIIASVVVMIAFCIMGLLAAATASMGTTSRMLYVDDAGVLEKDSRVLITGLNAKYYKRGAPYTLVVATRHGQPPASDTSDYSDYKTNVFNDVVKRLSIDDSADGDGIMILLMPDAHSYVVMIGGEVQGSIRDELGDGRVPVDSTVTDSLRRGDWNDAVKDILVLTDGIIMSASATSSVPSDGESWIPVSDGGKTLAIVDIIVHAPNIIMTLVLAVMVTAGIIVRADEEGQRGRDGGKLLRSVSSMLGMSGSA